MDVCVDVSSDAVLVVPKKVAPMVASKKVCLCTYSISSPISRSWGKTANNITKWNQVQEELKEDLKEDAAAPVPPTSVVCDCMRLQFWYQ